MQKLYIIHGWTYKPEPWEEVIAELKKEYKKVAKTDEDVLSIALFENIAVNFLKKKYGLEAEEFNISL